MQSPEWTEHGHRAGGWAECWRLAWPLIISNSFWTLQIALDRIMLGWYETDAMAAAMPAAMIFWTPFALFQATAMYATTFVAQYSAPAVTSASGRPFGKPFTSA